MPTITNFSPNNGPAGTTITINGTGLTGYSQITFHTGAASTTVVTANPASDTQMKVVVPVNAVTGIFFLTSNSQTIGTFTILSQPGFGYFTQLSVKIYGSGFIGTTSVMFGNVAATSFTVVSDSEIDAEMPPGYNGIISVTNPAGVTNSLSCPEPIPFLRKT